MPYLETTYWHADVGTDGYVKKVVVEDWEWCWPLNRGFGQLCGRH